MPLANQISNLSPNSQHLLVAVGAPTNLEGVALLAPQISGCVQPASGFWPTDSMTTWNQAATDLKSELKNLSSSAIGVAVHWHQRPTQTSPVCAEFLKWRSPVLDSGVEADLHKILGRAIIVAAAHHQTLHLDLISGCHTARLAFLRKGKRSRDWIRLLELRLTDAQQLRSRLSDFDIQSPCSPFLMALLASLETPIPQAVCPVTKPDASECETAEPVGASDHSRVKTREFGNDRSENKSLEDHTISPIPDMGRRLAGADFQGFDEKLGIYQRDQLLLDDLTLVTKKLTVHLKEGDRVRQGFAILALTSLLTGCTDFVALNLEFSFRLSIWLELSKGCWAWDFRLYRSTKKSAEVLAADPEPVFIEFPVDLWEILVAAKSLAPATQTLQQAIESWQGVDKFDIEAFREFLKSCGDSAHPPYRGRFARSIAGAYLQVTGSDMLAALMTGHSGATAPAALYYYGPTYKTVRDNISRVYQRLGLDQPSNKIDDTVRMGCQKVLLSSALKEGWEQLVDDINRLQDRIESSLNDTEFIITFNELMLLLCTAFVIQSAHRGTRFDFLTFGSLFILAEALLIHDKDDAETNRPQPRLVPRTSALAAILSAACRCHLLLNQRYGAVGTNKPVRQEGSDLFFISLESDGSGKVVRQCIVTGQVSAQTSKYFFGSDHNFGRSQWVTSLDKDSCDRWLIRSLTGHTRDVTRTNGAYMDIPPLVAARRLKDEMERTGSRLFGDSRPRNDGKIPEIQRRVSLEERGILEPGFRVPDPRTILPPLSGNTITGFALTNSIRADLASGQLDAPVHVLAVLHLLFIDLVPDLESCVLAVSRNSDSLKFIGRRVGLLWKRPHFVHSTWLPLQPTTVELIRIGATTTPSRYLLISQVCCTVRAKWTANWPAKDEDCWAAMGLAAYGFRRLSLAPSICALSLPALPAPTLSELSLRRLAIDSNLLSVPALPRSQGPRKLKSVSKGADLKALQSHLSANSSTVDRFGERRARAKKCIAEIRVADVLWTTLGRWFRDWIFEELERSYKLLKDSYALSSLVTYLTTLLISIDQLPTYLDPYEWEEEEWLAYALEVNARCCRFSILVLDASQQPVLADRARNALGALLRSLMRRQQAVPMKLLKMLGESAEPLPHGSASSVLILHGDSANCVARLNQANADFPLDALQLELRVALAAIPMRSGEPGSLFSDCITGSGGLVIQRAGYDIHKSGNAIRVVPLAKPMLATTIRLRHEIEKYQGPQVLLLRGNGSVEAGMRDELHLTELSRALKHVTGDPKARPHSLRAVAVQELCWPDWQFVARKFLNMESDSAAINSWVIGLHQDWTRLSRAAAFAGHGDLQSAFGNYLAGWGLVYAIQFAALASQLHPSPVLLKTLKVGPTSLRKARSRAHRDRPSGSSESRIFDAWHWISAHLARRQQMKCQAKNGGITKPAVDRKSPDAAPPPDAEILPSPALKVLYLTLRCLGREQGRALEDCDIRLSTAMELERALPAGELAALATRRARMDAQSRGQFANISLASSDRGREIVAWQLSLQNEDSIALKNALFRQDSCLDRHDDRSEQTWARLTMKLPGGLCMGVQRGAAYVTSNEVAAMSKLGDRMSFSSNPRIGARPVVAIGLRARKNRVQGARLTSVTRTVALAIEALRSSLREQ